MSTGRIGEHVLLTYLLLLRLFLLFYLLLLLLFYHRAYVHALSHRRATV